MPANTAILNPLDPVGAQVEQLAIDRQRQLAQALQQQSMTPAQGQMVSGYYVAPSWTQFAAKLAQGLSGNQMDNELDKKTIAYQQASMDSLIRALGGQSPQTALQQGASAGSVGPTNDNAARMNAGAPSPLNPANMPPQLAAHMLMQNPAEYWKSQAGMFAPTEQTRLAMQSGQPVQAANAAGLAKLNYIQPIDAKPGSTLIDPTTKLPFFNAPQSNGNYIDYDALGQPTMRRATGADASVAAAAAAELAGKNRQTMLPTADLPTDASGRKLPVTVGQAVSAANAEFDRNKPAPTSNFGNIVPGQSDRISILQQEREKLTKPEDIAAIDREIARVKSSEQPLRLGAPYGQEKAVNDKLTGLDKSWNDLDAQNRSAEGTISYLQNIKGLADKAIVGAQSDKLALANGLLAMVGNEKAVDAKTANDLLSKYSSQIVAKLGQGSLGTDAARTIVEAATPNAHMEKGAIKEAVDNLVGAQRMTQAKASFLQQHALSRNPDAYTQAETKFDQAADPRIWQYAAMNPQERAAFKQKLVQQGIAGEFSNKIRQLESMGVKF